jgi:xylan 1,4-beta-xylosidase
VTVTPRSRPLAAAAALLCLLVLAAPARAQAPSPFAAPAIPGNHPDPTIMQASDGAFYASSTSGDWAPIFPIFRSTDLVNWQQVGSIFIAAPRRTAGNYWAPELVQWSGRFLAFYSASRPKGSPCIGVAEAPAAQGPWTDRGRAVCWPHGVIDPYPFTDADGSRWLIFKGMGTGGAIYAMRFDEQRLRAYGPATLLVSPTNKWEQGVTEGPSLLLHNGTYYLFYSGGHCCQPPCTYAEGIARAGSLLGPYVKDPDNPILTGDEQWKCPGHGTVLDLGASGVVFLHHAYTADDVLDSRRQALLDSVDFGADGWPMIDRGADTLQPVAQAQSAPATPAPSGAFTDGFTGSALAVGWEWPFNDPPAATVTGGALNLGCNRSRTNPAFVSRQLVAQRFYAVASLDPAALKGPGGVGLAGYGPGSLFRGVEVQGGSVRAFVVSRGTTAAGPPVPAPPGAQLDLLLSATPDGGIGFYASGDGRTYVEVPGGPAATGPLPTRIALTCRGRAAGRFLAARLRVAAP